MKIEDYNAKLHEDITAINDKVRRDMLPLVARLPTMEAVVDAYITDHDEYFEELRRQAEADGRRGENAVPIAYRNTGALHRMADLVLHEELTWSHPDKMSIVEYPIMSDRQADERERKYTCNSDLQFGDRQYNSRRKTSFTDNDGAPQVRTHRMAKSSDPTIDAVGGLVDSYNALDNAGLTNRQRQAIDLVYIEDMTQEQAAEKMGVSRQAVEQFSSAGLANIRRNLKGADSIGE